MDLTHNEIITHIQALWSPLALFLRNLMLPSRLYQVGGICVLALISVGLRMMVAPRLREWLRRRSHWPKWRLRAGVLIVQRLSVIFYALLAWAAVLILREVTWPSRSQLLALSATITTAWLLVSFVVRLIRNQFLRRILSWMAWIYVTLYYLDLTGPVARALDGVAITFGSFRLSLLVLIKAFLVTGLLIALARSISRIISGRLEKNQHISPSIKVLVSKLVQVGLFTFAFILGLKAVGFDLTGLAVFSGAVGVGLGFGLQKVVSNLVSGVIILLDKSVKPGDVITIGNTFGWIEELGARYVSVVTRDGREYLIPNEDLVTGQVVNWSHTNNFVRLDIHFGTSYSDDPHEVTKVAINAALGVPRVLAQRRPVCWITGFGDSSVDYVLRFWISDPRGGLTNVRGQVYLALWDGFKAKGISIPFPQRELRFLNPLSQEPAGQGEDAPADGMGARDGTPA